MDGCPRGYRIVSVNGTNVTHRYRSSCESYVDRQGEFIGLKDRVAVGGKIDFVFNCYDAPNGSLAEARIGTRNWQAMTTINYGSTAVTKPHHFRLVTDTNGLQPGLHVVEARVTWPDATVVREKRSIKVVQ